MLYLLSMSLSTIRLGTLPVWRVVKRCGAWRMDSGVVSHSVSVRELRLIDRQEKGMKAVMRNGITSSILIVKEG